jgi:hypothetical protein
VTSVKVTNYAGSYSLNDIANDNDNGLLGASVVKLSFRTTVTFRGILIFSYVLGLH